jgi:hypothetical protein
MFLENKIKICLKFAKKIIFTIWSLYVMICKTHDPVEINSNYQMYLVVYFIIFIKLDHFCTISVFYF